MNNESSSVGVLPRPIPSGSRSTDRRQALWETLTVSLGALVVVGAGILGIWESSTHSIRENYRHYLMGLAETAATLVDTDLHDSIRRPEQRNNPDYRRAVAPLRRMNQAVADVHYVFTVIRDGSQIRFVLDSGNPAGENGAVVDDQANVLEIYDGPHPALWAALGSDGVPGHPAANEEPVRDKWGWFMTGAAPLVNAAGHQVGAVGVDVDASIYVARLATARNWALFGLIPAGVLITLLGSAFYRIRMRGLADARSAIDNAEAAERAAAVLAAERQRLSAVIEGTDVGIWEWDVAGKTWVVDQRCAAMIGRSAEALSPIAAEAWQALVHPDDLPQLQKAVEACMNTPAGDLRPRVSDAACGRALDLGAHARQGDGARRGRSGAAHGGHPPGRLGAQGGRAVAQGKRDQVPVAVRALARGNLAQRSAHRTIPEGQRRDGGAHRLYARRTAADDLLGHHARPTTRPARPPSSNPWSRAPATARTRSSTSARTAPPTRCCSRAYG